MFFYSANLCLLCAWYNEHYSFPALKEVVVLSHFFLSFITKLKWLNPSLILDVISSESVSSMYHSFIFKWLMGSHLSH